MRKLLFLIMLFSFKFNLASSQKIQFKTYKDTVHKISFDIPTFWAIKYSKQENGVICIPTTKPQKDIYKDCFEGIVFRMDFENYGLDTLLSREFDKVADKYVTSDRLRHDVPINFIKGKNWKGVWHNNICGISCRNSGFHAGVGECQFFYFCKGEKTIEIETNGRAFDEMVINQLLGSFKFLDK